MIDKPQILFAKHHEKHQRHIALLAELKERDTRVLVGLIPGRFEPPCEEWKALKWKISR